MRRRAIPSNGGTPFLIRSTARCIRQKSLILRRKICTCRKPLSRAAQATGCMRSFPRRLTGFSPITPYTPNVITLSATSRGVVRINAVGALCLTRRAKYALIPTGGALSGRTQKSSSLWITTYWRVSMVSISLRSWPGRITG